MSISRLRESTPDKALAWGAACVLVALLTACGGKAGTVAAPTAEYLAFDNATQVTINGYTGDAMEPFVSKDGLYLFFNNRNDPAVNTDIFYASRVDDSTFNFEGPVTGLNSPALDAVSSLDGAGDFYFVSSRSYTSTLSTIYTANFANGTASNVSLVAGVSQQQNGMVNFDAEISGDGMTLWFNDGKYSSSGVLEAASIAAAQRSGDGFVRRADNDIVLAAVNMAGLNYAPCISEDGLELLFTRIDSLASGSQPAIYRATRSSTTSAFDLPQHVAAATGFVEAPTLSADGHTLYFHKMLNGLFVIFRAVR